jgi:hypothetical protein
MINTVTRIDEFQENSSSSSEWSFDDKAYKEWLQNIQKDINKESKIQNEERHKQIFLLNLEDTISSKINRKELMEIAKKGIDKWDIIINNKGEVDNITIDKNWKRVDSALFGLARDRFWNKFAITYRLETRSTNFKNWFGDRQNDPKNASKVVDKNWEPWMVFHGGKKKFDEFKTWLNSQWWWSFGVFTTSQKEIAESYAKEKWDNDVEVTESTLYSLFVVIKKPIIFQNKVELENKIKELWWWWFNDRKALEKAAAILKSEYDGLYIKESDWYDQIMSFDTKNLKSVENIWSFSTNDAKIAA